MGPKASRLIEFNHSLEQKNTHKFNFGLVSNRFELASSAGPTPVMVLEPHGQWKPN